MRKIDKIFSHIYNYKMADNEEHLLNELDYSNDRIEELEKENEELKKKCNNLEGIIGDYSDDFFKLVHFIKDASSPEHFERLRKSLRMGGGGIDKLTNDKAGNDYLEKYLGMDGQD